MIVKHSTLAETTYTSLKELILTGHYAPGQRLQIEAVSKELGVSPTPLREAFVRLKNEGFLEMQARKGAYVRMLDQDVVQQSYEIREVLEGLGARLAAIHATQDQIDDVRKTNREFRAAVDKHRVKQALEADIRFHYAICEMSNNTKLKDIIHSYLLTNLFNNTGTSNLFLENGVDAAEGHDAIINAIAARNPDAAEEIMRREIRKGIAIVSSVFANGMGVLR